MNARHILNQFYAIAYGVGHATVFTMWFAFALLLLSMRLDISSIYPVLIGVGVFGAMGNAVYYMFRFHNAREGRT